MKRNNKFFSKRMALWVCTLALCFFLQPKLYAQYCASEAAFTFDSRIDSVAFGNMSNFTNPTGNECATYTDYTDSAAYVINVFPGDTLNLSVVAGTCGGDWEKFVLAYIDFNGDEVFDSTEEVMSTGNVNPRTLFQEEVIIPNNAVPGSTRMRIIVSETFGTSATGPCSGYDYGETQDYTVNIIDSSDMAYVETTTNRRDSSSVAQGFSNQEILKVNVITSGVFTPLTVGDLFFNLAQTDDAGDIAAARLYTSGAIGQLDTTNQVGSTITNLSNNFSFSVNDTLSAGNNYFWLVYDIDGSATNNNVVDARLDSLVVGDTTRLPLGPAPTATRTIMSPLVGTYSIGANGDYATFNAAVTDLVNLGVAGAVTFEVDSGIYSERIVLPEIAGASATNTITFDGIDTATRTLTHGSSVSAERAAIVLDGAKYLRFKNLSILADDNESFAWAMWLTNNAYDIEVDACAIYASRTSASQNYNGIISSGSATSALTNGQNADKVSVLNSHLVGGYNGIRFNGASATDRNSNFLIDNNEMTEQYYYAMYINNCDSFYISDNYINPLRLASGASTTTFTRPLYIIRANGYFEVTGNNMESYLYTGIHIQSSDVPGTPALIANNSIGAGFMNSSTTAAGGIYVTSSENMRIVYNSINNDEAGGNGIRLTTSADDIQLFNNSIAYTGSGSGFALSAASAASIVQSDYNNFYSTGSNFVTVGTAYADLAALISGANIDSNSFEGDPGYTSDTNLLPNLPQLYRNAVVLTDVTTDITGAARDAQNPSIGAYEFTLPDDDIGLVAFTAAPDACPTDSAFFSFEISNFGLAAQSGFPININISGDLDTSITLTISDTLESSDFAELTYYFNSIGFDSIFVEVFSDLAGDEVRSNDTITHVFLFDEIPAAPTVDSMSFCEVQSNLLLTASSFTTSSLNWYSDEAGENLLGSGDSFLIEGPFASDTTFYAKGQNAAFESVGMPEPITTTFYGVAVSGIRFSAETAFTLDSASIWPQDSGFIVVALQDDNQNIIEEDTFHFTNINTRTALPLEFDVPGAGIYRLVMTGSSTSFRRDFSSNVDFPYTIPDIMSITDGILTNTTSGSYYFFYDVKVNTGGCESDAVPLNISIEELPLVGIDRVAPYNGTEGDGTAQRADSVCAGDTLTYEVIPPTGFTNADFGTEWIITDLVVETEAGTPASDIDVSNPGLDNGRLTFVGATPDADSLFEVRLTVSFVGSTCDTVITNYIYTNPTPMADFTIEDLCLGGDLDLNNNSSGLNLNYEWDFGDNTVMSGENPNHNYTDTGTFEVTLTVTSGSAACMATAQAEVQVFGLPVADFEVDDVCAFDSAVFVNNSIDPNGGNLSFNWDLPQGMSSTDANPRLAIDLVDNYDVKLVVTTDNGCQDSVEQSMEVFPLADVDFTVNGAACQNDTFTFSEMVSYGLDKDSLNYEWSVNGVMVSTMAEFAYQFDTAGMQDINLTVVTENACVTTKDEMVEVAHVPTAAFDFEAACENQDVDFVNETTYEGAENLSYSWFFNAQATSVLEEPSHNFGDTGIYDVRLEVVTADNNCMDETSLSVQVNSVPEVAFEVEDFCALDSFVFENNTEIASGEALEYAWTFGDGGFSEEEVPTYAYEFDGEYEVNLVAMSASGCEAMASEMLTVFPLPNAAFTSELVDAATYTFEPEESGLESYAWDFGDGNNSTEEMPTHAFEQNDDYNVRLVVSDNNECTQLFAETISVTTVGMSMAKSQFDLNIYPNPYKDFTNIVYELDEASNVSLEIYDALGKRVHQMVETYQAPGSHNYQVDQAVTSAAGVYFVRLQVGEITTTKRIVKVN